MHRVPSFIKEKCRHPSPRREPLRTFKELCEEVGVPLSYASARYAKDKDRPRSEFDRGNASGGKSYFKRSVLVPWLQALKEGMGK